jgi:hypothetical protein
MSKPVTYIHFTLNGPGKSPNSESYDEQEYNEGLFTLDDAVREYIKDGYTSIILEVRADETPTEGS